MTSAEILQIAAEIAAFDGHSVGRIHPLSKTSFAVSWTPHPGAYLHIDTQRHDPSVFPIVRKAKLLARSTKPHTEFTQGLERLLRNAQCDGVEASEDLMCLKFQTIDAAALFLWISLTPGTGYAAVLNEQGAVLTDSDGMGGSKLAGQIARFVPLGLPESTGVSKRLDGELLQLEADVAFDGMALRARKDLDRRERKLRKLLENLAGDRQRHGAPDEWKKIGDLVLANLSSLRIEAGFVVMQDLYDPELTQIRVPIEPNVAPSGLAESYFRRYTKARNALVAIAAREKEVGEMLADIAAARRELLEVIESGDRDALAAPSGAAEAAVAKRRRESRVANAFKGVRRFVSSEGYEILVGKKATDNDHLTFRLARSMDTWLHAADYPGSHVVVRNPQRRDLPHKTLIEAAKLAAFYSDARELPKAAVNHTPKKFVNKPRRSAPGLVSLANFRTILVEPSFPDDVVKKET